MDQCQHLDGYMEKDIVLETNDESQPLGPGARLSLWIGVIRAREEEWPLQDGRMGTRLQLLRPPSRNYGLGAEHKYRETSCTTLREESMAAGQVWHYRGIRGEMTGAALTGRPGIIPTLTHIINSHIRV